MAWDDISLEITEGIARLSFTRDHKLNAMRDQTAQELTAALAEAEARGARAILLTGAGRAFGAGYDLSTLDPTAIPDLAGVLERCFNPAVRAMRQSPLPIVAAVNGACVGGSAGIALAADIVIAGRSAYFLEPFTGIALVPDVGNSLFLPRIAGRIRASAALLLGERISAEEAQDWGLVWRVVEDADLIPAAEAICRRLALRAQDALAMTKRLITQAAEPDLNQLLDSERDLQGPAGRSAEMRAAVDAFFAARRVLG